LRHVILVEGVVVTNSKKIELVKDWIILHSLKELRGFLGLVGYYRKFIRQFGIIKRPLTNLLTKNHFGWSEKAQEAFEQLKKALYEALMFGLTSIRLILKINACDFRLGVMLSQKSMSFSLFFNKALSPKHIEISIYEKEYLGILMIMEKRRNCLEQEKFTKT